MSAIADPLFEGWFRFASLTGFSAMARAGLMRSLAESGAKDSEELAEALRRLLPDEARGIIMRQFCATAVSHEMQRRLQLCRITPLHFNSPEYPPPLREIADPPAVLYRRGRIPPWPRPRIALVGSRTPTSYGRKCAWRLAAGLAERGVSIVSGLARGIDAIGHSAALEKGGETIAVCGCGLDMVYPQEHQRLFRRIAECGTIYSEYPPGTPPRKEHFPQRNRLMSGLADGVLVVEAGERSGSLITARLGLEQNREIFAVPGNIDSPRSAGSNRLLAQGARAVAEAYEVVAELKLRYSAYFEKNGGAPAAAAENPVDILSPDENTVLSFLEENQGPSWPQLSQALGGTVPDLARVLIDLEMRGRVRQDRDGNYYSLRAVKCGKNDV